MRNIDFDKFSEHSLVLRNYAKNFDIHLLEEIETIVKQKESACKHYEIPFNFTLNILRFPSFQSPLVLPDDLRNTFKQNLEKFLRQFGSLLEEMETNQVQRLVDYLDVVKTPHKDSASVDKLRKDFKTFYTQYDKRRGKNFEKTFPIIGEWYRGL